MNEKQKEAYEWVKAHSDYRSVDARHAQTLAGLVDELAAAGVITIETAKETGT